MSIPVKRVLHQRASACSGSATDGFFLRHEATEGELGPRVVRTDGDIQARRLVRQQQDRVPARGGRLPARATGRRRGPGAGQPAPRAGHRPGPRHEPHGLGRAAAGRLGPRPPPAGTGPDRRAGGPCARPGGGDGREDPGRGRQAGLVLPARPRVEEILHDRRQHRLQRRAGCTGASTASRATSSSRSRGSSPRANGSSGARATKKFSAGFNLRDLWIGSEGMLGVVTDAVLKLIPRPAARWTLLVSVPDGDRRVQGGAGPLRPARAAGDLRVPRPVLGRVRGARDREEPVFRGQAGRPVVLLEFAGGGAEVREQRAAALRWARRHGLAHRAARSRREAEAPLGGEAHVLGRHVRARRLEAERGRRRPDGELRAVRPLPRGPAQGVRPADPDVRPPGRRQPPRQHHVPRAPTRRNAARRRARSAG